MMLLSQKSLQGKLSWIFFFIFALLKPTMSTMEREAIQCAECKHKVVGQESTMPCPTLRICKIHQCGNINRPAILWKCRCDWHIYKPTSECKGCVTHCDCKVYKEKYEKLAMRCSFGIINAGRNSA